MGASEYLARGNVDHLHISGRLTCYCFVRTSKNCVHVLSSVAVHACTSPCRIPFVLILGMPIRCNPETVKKSKEVELILTRLSYFLQGKWCASVAKASAEEECAAAEEEMKGWFAAAEQVRLRSWGGLLLDGSSLPALDRVHLFSTKTHSIIFDMYISTFEHVPETRYYLALCLC